MQDSIQQKNLHPTVHQNATLQNNDQQTDLAHRLGPNNLTPKPTNTQSRYHHTKICQMIKEFKLSFA